MPVKNYLILVFFILAIFSTSISPAFANHQCGNGICQPSGHHNESCSSCASDCGMCPAPSPTPTPVPTASPSPTPMPSGTPTPSPTPSGSSAPNPTPSPESNSSKDATQQNSITISAEPRVSLQTLFTSPTRNTTVEFAGSASIEGGSIKQIEYSFTRGAQWAVASTTNNLFSFSQQLSEGSYQVWVRAKSQNGRYTESSNYAVSSFVIATTPPTVRLDVLPSSHKVKDIVISGSVVASLGGVRYVEVTLDGGTTWERANLRGNSFQLTGVGLEDDNYLVQARAIDNAGNIATSASQQIVIDTIPPRIGGSQQKVGPLAVVPDQDNSVSVSVNTPLTVTLSMKGGVIKAHATLNNKTFELKKIAGTQLWTTNVFATSTGTFPLSISAEDGAQNETTRKLFDIQVAASGKLFDQDTQQPVDQVKVFVYSLDQSTQQWVLWDGLTFGQQNPVTPTDSFYGYFLPSGTYYIEVKAPSYKTTQTTRFSLDKTTPVAFPLGLSQNRGITLGQIRFSIPSLIPAIHYIDDISTIPIKNNLASTSAIPLSAELTTIDGSPVKLNSIITKKTLVTFLSTWSDSSQEQASILELLNSSLQSDGQFQLVAIAIQDTPEMVNSFMRRGGYSFPILVDRDGILTNEYPIGSLPSHAVTDAEGKTLQSMYGVYSATELEQLLSSKP